MNITLSADPELISKSRKYARSHNTTLNNLIRDYLRQVVGEHDLDEVAEEFSQLARNKGGCSEDGFRFDRTALHQRGRGQ